MSPAEVLRAIEEVARPWVTARKGHVHVSASLDHTIHLLALTPTGFRLVLQWAGEKPLPNSFDAAVDLEIKAIVQYARGLAVDPGAGRHAPRAP